MQLSAVVMAGIIITALGSIYVGWRRVRPSVRLWLDARDVIAGRDPVLDKAGKVAKEGQPGLAYWMGGVTAELAQMTSVIADQKKADARIASADALLASHELRLNDHDTSLAAIIAHTFETGANANLKAAEIEQAEGGKS